VPLEHNCQKRISFLICLLATPDPFDVHESVHRDTVMKVTNKKQLYRLTYYS